MKNVNWSKVGMYTSLVLTFCIAGLQAIGASVPDSGTIILILTFVAGLLHGPAVNTAVGNALAGRQ